MSPPLAHPWCRPDFPLPGERFRLGRLLLREPEYALLWRKHQNIGLLERAGFFDDQMSREEVRHFLAPDRAHREWMSPLPTHKDWERARQSGRPVVVLLATGAFAPFHSGHQAMMQAAIDAAQEKGMQVLAAYFSPSHDHYVGGKDGGRGSEHPAAERIDRLRSQMPSSHGVSWLVDPWEAMGVPRAINFTTVVRRLQAYLNTHRPDGAPKARVVYVFGADNAEFSRAFHPNSPFHPATICVGRPGHDAPSAGLFAPLEHPESSTRLRRTHSFFAPGASRVENGDGNQGGTYLIRNEQGWATSHWSDKVPQQVLIHAWEQFAVRVRLVLEGAFACLGHRPYGVPCASSRPDSFSWIRVSEQRDQVARWAASRALVSLDPCVSDLPGVTKWPSSRVFEPSGWQAGPLCRAPRPGSSGLPDLLKGNRVWLVDDDIATGKSMANAREHLERQGVVIEQCRSLTPSGPLFDVVDLRDFLPGAREAGLVVQAPCGELVRVPYMAPFVNLVTRARVPEGRAWSTSLALWEAAAQFFESLPVALQVQDMWPASSLALELQGVCPAMPISQWCRRWAEGFRASGLQTDTGSG